MSTGSTQENNHHSYNFTLNTFHASHDEASQLNQTSSTVSSGSDGGKRRREIRLRTVTSTLENFQKNYCHNGVLSLLRNHTFVGCEDRIE